MSEQKGSSGWSWALQTLGDLKEKAKTRNSQLDWNLYIWYLKEFKKVTEKKYAESENQKWTEVLGKVLQLISCELKENMIKYKKL
jgi:hypothetical protein